MPGLWGREVTLGQIVVHVICIIHSYIHIYCFGSSLKVSYSNGLCPWNIQRSSLDLQFRQEDDWDIGGTGRRVEWIQMFRYSIDDPDMFIILRYMLRYRNV